MSEFSRIIGRRKTAPFGPLRAPSRAERAWVAALARRCTRVPKGLFRYRSHAEANRDWERWQAAALAAGAGDE